MAMAMAMAIAACGVDSDSAGSPEEEQDQGQVVPSFDGSSDQAESWLSAGSWLSAANTSAVYNVRAVAGSRYTAVSLELFGAPFLEAGQLAVKAAVHSSAGGETQSQLHTCVNGVPDEWITCAYALNPAISLAAGESIAITVTASKANMLVRNVMPVP
jgi:hypothetical protein